MISNKKQHPEDIDISWPAIRRRLYYKQVKVVTSQQTIEGKFVYYDANVGLMLVDAVMDGGTVPVVLLNRNEVKAIIVVDHEELTKLFYDLAQRQAESENVENTKSADVLATEKPRNHTD